jgi:hypothetical protein
MTIYHAMALDFPPWFFKPINKICQNYLWRGRKEALGFLIAWPKVTRPNDLGGLGIPSSSAAAYFVVESSYMQVMPV